jgi:hypothetical protein
MVTPADLVSLDYTPDLTRAGIAYACRSLPYTYDRMGGSHAARLRRIVAGKVVELAFRRHLDDLQLPYDLLGSTPFTQPDHYDLALGGRRCDIKSYMVYQKNRIRQIRRQPEKLLEANALVPADQANASHLGEKDLYIFAFLTALITPRKKDVERALSAGQSIFLLYAMPQRLARPKNWRSLERIEFDSSASLPLTLEVGGQNDRREFQTRQLVLPPKGHRVWDVDLCSLVYVHVSDMPDGSLEVHIPRLKTTITIRPHLWGNIWVYGMRIILVGYLPRGEFLRRAKVLPAGRASFPYPSTQTTNLALPMRELRPVADLLERLSTWAGMI